MSFVVLARILGIARVICPQGVWHTHLKGEITHVRRNTLPNTLAEHPAQKRWVGGGKILLLYFRTQNCSGKCFNHIHGNVEADRDMKTLQTSVLDAKNGRMGMGCVRAAFGGAETESILHAKRVPGVTLMCFKTSHHNIAAGTHFLCQCRITKAGT